MLKKMNMGTLFVSLVCSLCAFLSSCGDDGKGGGGGTPQPGEFSRYVTDLSMPSDRLGMVSYSVFLPEGYDVDRDKRYPVVYLLHGLGDDHKSWNDRYLNISSLVKELESGAGLEPMIYVMPQGYRSYYVNRYDGTYDYMDMFTQELVPYIDANYRTVADREHRAAVGYSMGGFGAMILPSKNPELFSVSVPLSMSFRTDQQYMSEPASGWNQQWGSIFGGYGATGEARLTDYYKQHCPYYMFTAETLPDYAGVSYFLDCGDDEEQLLVANDDLHVQMRDLEMPHEYRVRDGAHTSTYWRSGMREVLPYIQTVFAGGNPASEANVTIPADYNAVKENRTLAGVAAEVYLPMTYSADETNRFPSLYYIYGGEGMLPADDAARILSNAQQFRPFVLVAVAAADMDAAGIGFGELSEAAGAAYRLYGDASHTLGLAAGTGGRILYPASLDGSLAALFLSDASLGEGFGAPNPDVFYFISIADMGVNYRDANALYKQAHSDPAVSYQYRVVNGLPSARSAAVSLDGMKRSVQENIRTQQTK